MNRPRRTLLERNQRRRPSQLRRAAITSDNACKIRIEASCACVFQTVARRAASAGFTRPGSKLRSNLVSRKT
jgi:hypothetical protein